MMDFRGASRTSLAALRDDLVAAVGEEGDVAGLAGELFAVAVLLDGQPALRRGLTDPARSGDDRAGLARDVLAGQLERPAIDLVTAAVRASWSRPRDVADAVEHVAVLAEVLGAERDGRLDTVEDELFRFGRIVAGDDALQHALTDRTVPAEHRTRLARRLLEDRATRTTVRLVEQAVAAPRGLRLTEALETYAKVAAGWRESLVATVRSAVPLSADERGRLGRALARMYGHDVHLNVLVDPEVVGGLRIELGDEVIDGSVAGRLDAARRALAS